MDNMKISARVSRLGTESAFEVLAKAQALEAKGRDIIHLEIGEPDFETPENIRAAGIKALNDGLTNYCNAQGIVPLRAEIARMLERARGVPVDMDRVVVTTGAKPIMFYTILALLEVGDEAIYPDPGFPIYESVIKYSGATAVPLPLREELGFRFDIDELRTRITPRTRLLILNSPHNPTGSVLSEDDIRAVAEVIREHDITVLSDEIYEHIIYDAAPFSIAALPGMLDRTVLFSGFSKTYSMTGWRLGYAVLPPPLVGPVVRLIVNSVSCAPLFIQHAGIEALIGPQDSIPAMVAEFKERRDLIVDGLNRIPGISCRCPEGAFYVFPNVRQLNINCVELADILLNKAGVALLPGTHFGDCGDGYLRISYATSREKISQALLRISRAVAELTV